MKSWVKIVLVLIVVLAVDQAFGQCSQCKMMSDQNAGYHGGQALNSGGADSFNTAILYLMAFPYLLLMIFFRKKIYSIFKMLTSRK